MSRLRAVIVGSTVALGIALVSLALAPPRARPLAWSPPSPPSLAEGPYAANERLRGIERIARDRGHGPESLAVGADGSLFTGFEDGNVARLSADGSDYRLIANTAGRPLGIAFHPSGDLVIADATKGLLRVTIHGAGTILATAAEGERFAFCDDVAVDAAGRFAYFSDASSVWGYGKSTVDIIEHRGHGRLLRYDFASGAATVLLRGLQFANGVALDPDEQFVLVAETGAYQVTRYWLTGPRAGTSDVFVENLPGFPDNVRFAGRDRIWVALPSPRSALLDLLAPYPLARTPVARLAYTFPLASAGSSKAMAYDREGHLVANLQSTGAGAFASITQVTEIGGWLYFSSIEENAIGRLALSDAGLAAP